MAKNKNSNTRKARTYARNRTKLSRRGFEYFGWVAMAEIF